MDQQSLDDVDLGRHVRGNLEANFLLTNCGLVPNLHNFLLSARCRPKLDVPAEGPPTGTLTIFGALQSADLGHASPDPHGGYKPQAHPQRKSKALTNACAIRHLTAMREAPCSLLFRGQNRAARTRCQRPARKAWRQAVTGCISRGRMGETAGRQFGFGPAKLYLKVNGA